jgi:hypothetical protein
MNIGMGTYIPMGHIKTTMITPHWLSKTTQRNMDTVRGKWSQKG